MVSFIIYLCGIAGGIRVISILVMTIAILLYPFCIFVETREALGEYKKKIAAVIVVSMAICTLFPDGRTISAMFLVPRLMENEQIQNISKDGLDALEGLAQEWAAEYKK